MTVRRICSRTSASLEQTASPVGRSNTLFLVVGTPWKRPRSSRLCRPDCGDGDGWFGGISSTRTATLRMRLRNSCGSESSTSSTTLTKCSRFILHPLINKGTLTPSSRRRLRRNHRHLLCRCLRLPLFVFFPVWLFSKEDIGSYRPGLSRGILDVFCSCSMVRPVPLGKRRHSQCPGGRRAGSRS